MAKKESNRVKKAKPEKAGKGGSLFSESKTVDPSLASLFASSLGPVVAPPKSRYRPAATKELKELAEDSVDEDSEDETTGAQAKHAQSAADLLISGKTERPEKKRKRGGDDEPEAELEDVYMRKLAREEAREDAKHKIEKGKKRLKTTDEEENSASDSDSSSESEAEGMDDDASEQEEESAVDDDAKTPYTPPVHESLAPSSDAIELEKAARTVFLGNVSSTAIKSKSAKKTLLAHLASFIPDLAPQNTPHKVETIRFRSTAYAGVIPKKAAFALKEVMDATTKSTNAYAVYSTQVAAREAAKRLNGTIVLDRHLRVDEVAHPAKQDHKRCVFVGNLGFVDDETNIQAAEELENGKRSRKQKAPSDVEEGLWVQFSKAGPVESVRVVRDAKTRVSKGIAYVQFKDQNGVEAALQFNDQRYPPLLPRKLRVVRAKAFKRNAKPNASSSTKPNLTGGYAPKVSAEEKSMAGRAKKLLGRAGAAQVRKGQMALSGNKKQDFPSGFKRPEQIVFEGHRASIKQGHSGLKLGKTMKKKGVGKPTKHGSKRASAWKEKGKEA
ncbi:uncharacterized protein BDZ99DRAFT_465735 [Mytilinidion resinicola]|uniref:Nucleolar protein 12 n=1 Tax=Mytilinidion resinicola TaxID=574789 RepID=A0A6A6YGG3_9PEZI|nr:uncharacterized protein BDZ99DRAFT_465735 [Mytilinidion resinicola]KAF2806987.1 hypothetical protein BDZ99DRAFT_465735 [Mytilinidion resinicola]